VLILYKYYIPIDISVGDIGVLDLVSHMVFGCKIVPCNMIFEKMKPNGGKKTSKPAHGFRLINIMGTSAKLQV